ncbi:MAG: prepilin-type N-terminal cleavage/methylation domain-containing protein [Nitrospinae bacterium]|nr:prepilin-type N-terminal cleavage/methylation domain-containing protein [Nitrospinota bacterium]
MREVRRPREAGFTLIELLVVILIVGILSAAAVPIYFGYVKDAKAAEGKALIGALWTGLQACAQMAPGNTNTCTAFNQYSRTGINIATGVTFDGRWFVNGVPIVSFVNSNLTLSDPLTASGQANTDVAGIDISFTYNIGSNPPYQFMCIVDGVANPC